MFIKKIVIASIFFILLISLAFVFRPIPEPSPENTLKTFGTIEKVYEVGDEGVVLKLRGDDRKFYIDGGLRNGVTATKLQQSLPGQPVEIYFVKYWSPLDPMSKLKYITKVDCNRTTLYSAIK